MMIESARYLETGDIEAVIDGAGWIVPDDMGYRFRVMIAEWEADGHTIEPLPVAKPAP
jgi:hypothetical protein